MAETSDYRFSIPDGALTRKTVLTVENKNLIRAMKKAGKELVERRIASGDGGDLSARTDTGFIITASGADLSKLSDEDFVLVELFDSASNTLQRASGLGSPSSGTPAHNSIYTGHPEIRAIIRAEDPALTRQGVAKKLKIPSTQAGFPIGSHEIADEISSLLNEVGIIVVPGNSAFITNRSVEECAQKADIFHRRGASAKV